MFLCSLEEHSFVGVQKSCLAERRCVHWQQMMVALATPFVRPEPKKSGRVHAFSKTPGDHMLGLYPLLQLSSLVAPLLGHPGCFDQKMGMLKDCQLLHNLGCISCTFCGENSRAALKAASGIFMHH